jgi:hypothetical protein
VLWAEHCINTEGVLLVLCADHYSNTERAVSVISEQDQNSAPKISVLLFFPALEYRNANRDCVFLTNIKSRPGYIALLLRPELLYIIH